MSKFLVIEKPSGVPPMSMESPEARQMMKMWQSDFEYKIKLQKDGKIIGGGPFLDIGALCYVLNVSSVEEMGEIFFNAPLNLWIQREVHPLGTFEDTLDGINQAM